MDTAQNIEKLDIQTGFGGLINATSKISILGEMDTIVISRELLNVIHEALFRVLALLGPMHLHKSEGDTQEMKFAAQTSEIDRLAAEIQSVLEGNNDALRLRGLKRAIEFRLADAGKFQVAGLAAKTNYLTATNTPPALPSNNCSLSTCEGEQHGDGRIPQDRGYQRRIGRLIAPQLDRGK